MMKNMVMKNMVKAAAIEMFGRGFMPDSVDLEDELFKDGYDDDYIDEIVIEMENIIANFDVDETNRQIDAEFKKDFFNNLK